MNIIEKYFDNLGLQQKEQFSKLEPLYTIWNDRINVISRKDISNLYLHHVLHSLAVARVISFVPGTAVLDAGTGGGFPGIPLSILFPGARFILVDSIGKKLTVVNDIIRKLDLRNCEIINARVEDLTLKVDFLVSRAVSAMTEVAGWGRKLVIPGGRNSLANGMLILKGGDLRNELKNFQNKATVYDLEDYFQEEYFKTKKLIYIPV